MLHIHNCDPTVRRSTSLTFHVKMYTVHLWKAVQTAKRATSEWMMSLLSRLKWLQ